MEPETCVNASDIELVFQDEALLVLNKPPGLLSVPGRGSDKQDCLSSRVQQRYPNALVVHRLDMATSGLIVMAHNAAVQRTLNTAFAQRQMHKRYLAVVAGKPTHSSITPYQSGKWQTIELPIIVDWPNRPLRVIDALRGQPSVTHWRSLADHSAPNHAYIDPSLTDRNFTLLELAPAQGTPAGAGPSNFGRCAVRTTPHCRHGTAPAATCLHTGIYPPPYGTAYAVLLPGRVCITGVCVRHGANA
jgi:tRNA pseudouridine32 synthase / 23S rRNA pseudouridine746 synthase